MPDISEIDGGKKRKKVPIELVMGLLIGVWLLLYSVTMYSLREASGGKIEDGGKRKGA